MDDALPDPLALWFADRGWVPRRHQLDMLATAQAGQHALLVAPTGAGKTLAGFLPVLARSEEHTSELQSLMRISYAVFCLKKKKYKSTNSKSRPLHQCTRL